MQSKVIWFVCWFGEVMYVSVSFVLLLWITCGLFWCFYQLFELSFWRHPFTAEHPLVSFSLKNHSSCIWTFASIIACMQAKANILCHWQQICRYSLKIFPRLSCICNSASIFAFMQTDEWTNEWMMHLYRALLCIVVHPKHFTIIWGGGLFSTTTSVQHPLGCFVSRCTKFDFSLLLWQFYATFCQY